MRLEDVPTQGPQKEGETFDRLSVFDMDQIFISNASDDSKAVFDLGRGGYRDPVMGSQQIAAAIQQMSAEGVNFLHLDSMEVEMLPGVGGAEAAYRWRVPASLAGNDEAAFVDEMLGRFMQAAFRRPVAASEIEIKQQLFRELRQAGYAFDECLRETLASVLVSPSFLFLESYPANTDVSRMPERLASRLSYFLWLSPPDESLLEKANDGSLLESSVLRRQAETDAGRRTCT